MKFTMVTSLLFALLGAHQAAAICCNECGAVLQKCIDDCVAGGDSELLCDKVCYGQGVSSSFLSILIENWVLTSYSLAALMAATSAKSAVNYLSRIKVIFSDLISLPISSLSYSLMFRYLRGALDLAILHPNRCFLNTIGFTFSYRRQIFRVFVNTG